MKKYYKYDFILPFFTGCSEMRPCLMKVHKDDDGYIYATDAHIMIRIPADKVGNKYKNVAFYPKASKMVSDALNCPDNATHSIMVYDLIRILSKAKWHKEMRSEDSLIVKIDKLCFQSSYLNTLAIAAKVIGTDTIEFFSNGEHTALFRFDDVVILLASTKSDNPAMTLKTKTVTI